MNLDDFRCDSLSASRDASAECSHRQAVWPEVGRSQDLRALHLSPFPMRNRHRLKVDILETELLHHGLGESKGCLCTVRSGQTVRSRRGKPLKKMERFKIVEPEGCEVFHNHGIAMLLLPREHVRLSRRRGEE